MRHKKIIKTISLLALSILLMGMLAGCSNSVDAVALADVENEKLQELEGEMKAFSDYQYETVTSFVEEAENTITARELFEMQEFVLQNSVFVKSDTLNVRKEADINSDVVHSLSKSDTALIVDTVADENGVPQWYQIKLDYYDDEAIGWVSAKNVVMSREELIAIIYDGVDYSPYENTYEYESNPRVEVKGIYVTGHTAATNIDAMIDIANTTNINAFVIDVKDDNENLLFYSETAAKYSPTANDKRFIKDIEGFMQKLEDNDIYAIARIVSFKSPRYAKTHPEKAIIRRDTGELFQSSDGLIWSSPYNRELWEYNVGVAKEAAELGFNEIQFDYVRFPASGGGKLDSSLNYRNELDETKTEAIQKFLKYAHSELSPMEVYVAADVFGWAASAISDVGIGQQWEAITSVVDYICPMMYPSHYGPGNFGLSVPDAYPYETIDRSLNDALDRNKNVQNPATIRPWIQDFTASWVSGHIRYGEAELRAQIQALEDNGVNEYLIWNAGNKYTTSALKE